jgi:hypothetical protein
MKISDFLSEDNDNMGLTKEIKEKIDNMTYEEMLDAWKNSDPDDLMFKIPIGEYFATVLENKRLKK